MAECWSAQQCALPQQTAHYAPASYSLKILQCPLKAGNLMLCTKQFHFLTLELDGGRSCQIKKKLTTTRVTINAKLIDLDNVSVIILRMLL